MNIIKGINTCCFLCILFFIHFECFIGNTVFEPIIRLRTISYLCLFISTFFIFKKKLPHVSNISFRLFGYFYFIIGVINFFSFLSIENINGFIVYKQFYLFLLLFYTFYFLEDISFLTYSDVKKYLVISAGFFVVTNTICYFWNDSSIWQKPKAPGRIGRGYSTLDVISLTFSYIILLMDNNLKIPRSHCLLLMVLIPLGIILLASGTGIFTLGLTIISFIAINLLYTNFYQKARKQFYQSIIILSAFFVIGWGILLREEPAIAESLVTTMENRIGVMLEGKNYESEINTIEWREEQYDYITKKFIRSPWDYLFGVGFSKVNYSDTRNSNSIYIENQYNLNKVTLGIIGSILFILSLLEVCVRIYKLPIKPRHFMYYIAIMVFAASCYTIVPMQTFSVLSYFALFLVLLYREPIVKTSRSYKKII